MYWDSSYENKWFYCVNDVNQDYWLLMKMVILSFQIRCVQQMCQDFNSQDFELILRIVSAVYIAL